MKKQKIKPPLKKGKPKQMVKPPKKGKEVVIPPEPPKPLETIKSLGISDDKIQMVRDKMIVMRYKDLQSNCISRGMTPEDLVKGDINTLQTWLIINWDIPQNQLRLSEFDKWREIELEKAGFKGEPYVRLGYIGQIDPNSGEVIVINKSNKMLTKPKKRERDEETGIFKGTKKAYTCELSRQGIAITQIIEMVVDKFPGAKEKSIKIWYKRFKKSK